VIITAAPSAKIVQMIFVNNANVNIVQNAQSEQATNGQALIAE
jgi:hypothetical protein